jgi:PadR family transcriptional regulator, regulatory protein AphA
VVLGLLAYGSASAYALRQRIGASVGFFWQESFGQLFPTLAQLEREGLVRGRPARAGKRRRRDYEITTAGREALAAWLREPPLPQPERNELLLKVFFASEGDVGELGGSIAEADANARAQLQALRAVEADLQLRFATDARMPFRLLTVRYGILGWEAFRRWAREARRVVESQPGGVST